MRRLTGLTILVAGAMLALPAQAQTKRQLDLCNNVGNKSTPEQMVSNCAAFIQGKTRGAQLGPFYVNRGIGYFGLQQYDKAMADFERALELIPKNPIPYLQRANVWLARGQPEKAVADLNRSVELNPKWVFRESSG